MIDHCEKVLKLDEKNFKAFYNIIVAYAAMKNKKM